MSRRPALTLIFAITLTGILNNTLVTPAIPDILEDLDQPSDRSGILVAVGSIAGIVLAPLIGFLADRFGRRLVLTTCLLIFGVFGLMAALAPTFEILLLARLLQGVGSAGLINLAVVLIGDHWSGQERTRLVGRNSAVLTVGLAAVPLLSGAVTEIAGWRVAFGIYTLAFATAGWVWLSITEEKPTDPPEIRSQLGGALDVVRTPVVAATILTGFVVFVVIFGLMLTALPVHLAEEFGLGAGARGLIISIPAVSSTIAAFNLDRLRAAVSPRTIVTASGVALSVAFVSIGLAVVLAVIVFGAIIYGFAEGSLIPTLQDINVSASPDEHRGAVVAIWVGAVRLGQTIGSLLGGVGLAVLGSGPTLVVGAAAAAVIALFGILGPLPRTVPAVAA